MIFLLTLLSLLPLETPAGPLCSVSGKVVNAVTGEPIRGAQVNASTPVPLVSDAAGQFSAAAVPCGTVYVWAMSPRYPGLFGMAQATATLTLKPGESRSDIILRLVPGAVITGRIVDDSGEPLTNCSVTLSPAAASPRNNLPGGNATTNDKGEYRLYNVAPNLYHVRARCTASLPVNRPLAQFERGGFEPEESWMPVYYPNSSAKSGASVLAAMPGAQLDGINFQMRPTRVATLHGSVELPPGLPEQAFVQGRIISLSDPDAAPEMVGVARPAGTFLCQFLLPGAYRIDLWAALNGPQQNLAATGSAQVSIGNTPPAPIAITLGPPPVVKGSLDIPSEANPPAAAIQQFAGPVNNDKPHIWLQPAGDAPYVSSPQADATENNTFELQGVLPGRWRVVVQPHGSSSYIESIEWGQQRVSGHDLEVASGDTGPLHIRLSNDYGKLRGTLPGGVQAPVYAIPLDRALDDASMSPIGFSQNGAFVSDRVRPGNYKLFAFAQGALPINEELVQLLARRGVAVEVTHGSEQSAEVPLFSSDDLYQAMLEYLRSR